MNSAGPAPRPGGRRPAVTLHDVAKAAGVSVATASHVANGRTDVRMSDRTRQRVQATIDELGYRSNALAKHLVKGSSQFIGLVADAIATTPFAGQIISGAQDEAWRHGFVLLVANTDSDTAVETEAIEMMLDHRVRGILYSTWFHRRVTVPSGLPIADTVLVNCYSEDDAVRSVVPNEVQGGRAATEMLLAQGHRRIAMVNTVTESPARVGRLQGYRQALEAYGVPFDPTLVIDAVSDQEGGYDAYDRIPCERGLGGVLPQRPRRDGPLRCRARARPEDPRRPRRRRLRQPGRDLRAPSASAEHRAAAALRAGGGGHPRAARAREAGAGRDDAARLPGGGARLRARGGSPNGLLNRRVGSPLPWRVPRCPRR